MTGEEILKDIPDLCASTGAACHDQFLKISHVLEAMGVREKVGMGTIRLSLGRPTTDTEIDQAAQFLIEAVKNAYGLQVRKKA